MGLWHNFQNICKLIEIRNVFDGFIGKTLTKNKFCLVNSISVQIADSKTRGLTTNASLILVYIVFDSIRAIAVLKTANWRAAEHALRERDASRMLRTRFQSLSIKLDVAWPM